ncbi:hypothetical protein BDR26DRAFT_1010622 [Obelidium mucronatum]|nr:hypothetical protein BDR26DRAFT_1010622 [Obelidium mucronatum]
MTSKGIVSILAVENYDVAGDQKDTPGLADLQSLQLAFDPLTDAADSSEQSADESCRIQMEGMSGDFLVATRANDVLAVTHNENATNGSSNGNNTDIYQQQQKHLLQQEQQQHQQPQPLKPGEESDFLDQDFDFVANRRDLAHLRGIEDYAPTLATTPSIPSSYITSYHGDPNSSFGRYRYWLINTFAMTSTSKSSIYINSFFASIIFLSIISFTLGTVHIITQHYPAELFLFTVDTFCVAVFTIELCLRIFVIQSWQEFKSFGFSFMLFIDVVSTAPFYIEIAINVYDGAVGSSLVGAMINSEEFSTLRALRLLRVIRLFKFLRNNQKLMIVLEAVQQSVDGIIILVVTLSVMVCFFSSLLFFAEQMNETFDTAQGLWVYISDGSVSPFQSIPHTFYYMLGTLTNNPPAIPKTVLGQIIIMLAMILSLFVVAFPLTIITIQYAKTVKTFTQRQKALKEERQREKNDRRQRKLDAAAKAIAFPEDVSANYYPVTSWLRRRKSSRNSTASTLIPGGGGGGGGAGFPNVTTTGDSSSLNIKRHAENPLLLDFVGAHHPTDLAVAPTVTAPSSETETNTANDNNNNVNGSTRKRAVTFEKTLPSQDVTTISGVGGGGTVLSVQTPSGPSLISPATFIPPSSTASSSSVAKPSISQTTTVLRAVSAFKSSLKKNEYQSPNFSSRQSSLSSPSNSITTTLPSSKLATSKTKLSRAQQQQQQQTNQTSSSYSRLVPADSLESVEMKVLKLAKRSGNSSTAASSSSSGAPRHLEVKVMDWFYAADPTGSVEDDEDEDDDDKEDESDDDDDDQDSKDSDTFNNNSRDAKLRRKQQHQRPSAVKVLGGGGVAVLMNQADATAIGDKLVMRLCVRDEAHFKKIMKVLSEL